MLKTYINRTGGRSRINIFIDKSFIAANKLSCKKAHLHVDMTQIKDQDPDQVCVHHRDNRRQAGRNHLHIFSAEDVFSCCQPLSNRLELNNKT